MTEQSQSTTSVAVGGITLDTVRCGAGPPILVLHGMNHFPVDSPFLHKLARYGEVFAPSHPGFGASARPDDFDSIYDLTHLYLALARQLGTVTLIGLSFGGWLAAEVAVKSCASIERLVLIDTVGFKVSDRETADILDVFNTSPSEVNQQRWHAPETFAPNFDAMTDAQISDYARNWASLCLYGWHPYMHTPQLAKWLHAISAPTLLLWGSSDGIVSPTYGQAIQSRIPGSEFATIGEAGHHPEVERPDETVAHIARFIARTGSEQAS